MYLSTVQANPELINKLRLRVSYCYKKLLIVSQSLYSNKTLQNQQILIIISKTNFFVLTFVWFVFKNF